MLMLLICIDSRGERVPRSSDVVGGPCTASITDHLLTTTHPVVSHRHYTETSRLIGHVVSDVTGTCSTHEADSRLSRRSPARWQDLGQIKLAN